MTLRIAALPLLAAEPLAMMHRACFPQDPWDAAALERILAMAGGFGYLASDDNNPTGFILARDLGDEAEILSLGVLPQWRRRGVGQALLTAVSAEAGRRGLGALVLEVAVDNTPARRLYEACGFAPAGRRPRYYRRPDAAVDALILRRGIIGGER